MADPKSKDDEKTVLTEGSAASGKTTSDDEVMAIRKAAGSIAEVIEPVTRTSMQRTN